MGRTTSSLNVFWEPRDHWPPSKVTQPKRPNWLNVWTNWLGRPNWPHRPNRLTDPTGSTSQPNRLNDPTGWSLVSRRGHGESVEIWPRRGPRALPGLPGRRRRRIWCAFPASRDDEPLTRLKVTPVTEPGTARRSTPPGHDRTNRPYRPTG